LIDLLSSYNLIAEDYEQLFPNFENTMHTWNERLKNFIRLEDGQSKTILDVGCGIGVQSMVLAQLGFNVYAIDISEQMLEKGRKLSKNYDQKVKFIQGDCSQLGTVLPKNLKLNGFICCGSAILHLSPDDNTKLAKKLYNLLSKGSKGLIEFFNWSYIDIENCKWTPRSHFRNDNIESFSIEFFYDYDRQVNSSIILFERNWENNEPWQIKIQSDFCYWKYLPEEIAKFFIQAGFTKLDLLAGSIKNPTSTIVLQK